MPASGRSGPANSRESTADKECARARARWLPTLVTGKGQPPTSFTEFICATSNAPAADWRAAPYYAMSRWQGKLEHKQRFLGRIVDIGAEGRYTWLEEGILDPSIEGPWIAQDGGDGVAKDDVHRVIR